MARTCTLSDLQMSGQPQRTGCTQSGYQPLVDVETCRRFAASRDSSLDSGENGKDCVVEFTTRYRMVQPHLPGGHKMYRVCAPCDCDFGDGFFKNEVCPTPVPEPVPSPTPAPELTCHSWSDEERQEIIRTGDEQSVCLGLGDGYDWRQGGSVPGCKHDWCWCCKPFEPTPEPTVEPVADPTAEPTVQPTPALTAQPTPMPVDTWEPVPLPTADPTPVVAPEKICAQYHGDKKACKSSIVPKCNWDKKKEKCKFYTCDSFNSSGWKCDRKAKKLAEGMVCYWDFENEVCTSIKGEFECSMFNKDKKGCRKKVTTQAPEGGCKWVKDTKSCERK